MTITSLANLDLSAAILDQKVAGAFAGKRYAFVSVPVENAWGLGVAVADESGYNPVEGKTFTAQKESQTWADSLNAHIGLSETQIIEIVVSTMRGPRSYRR